MGNEKQRTVFKFHLSTIVVLLVVVGAFLQLNFSERHGGTYWDWSGDKSTESWLQQHLNMQNVRAYGWPLVYSVHFDTGLNIVSYTGVFINCVVATLGIAGSGVLIEILNRWAYARRRERCGATEL